MTTASQSFAIAYQFDTASVFKWTFPTNTDPLLSGRTHTLRWETTFTGAAQLSYAANGSNWRSIRTVADLSKSYFKWTLPDTITTAVLRMTVSANDFLSDTFTISKQPLVQVGFDCVDSFLLYWNRAGVTSFQLYELGAKYLQPFTQTVDTSILLRKAQHPSIYYAVALIINNKLGFRSYTLNYTSAGNSCYLRSCYLQAQTPTTALFFAEIGSLYNVAEVDFEKETPAGYTSLKTIGNPVTLTLILTSRKEQVSF